MNREEGVRRVERDIRQAKAETLGRVGERLEAALADLGAADRRVDRLVAEASAEPGHAARLTGELAARNRLRDEAARLHHQLIIQREAIGVFRHGPVHDRYPVPPRRLLGFTTTGS